MKIDKEFKELIPPLSKEEYSQLETNILEKGCLQPLIIWKTLLLDGHSRLDICNKHNITFETKIIDLPNRKHALLWIIDNQEGRRNLNSFTRSELQLKKKAILAEIAKENQRKHGGTAPGKKKNTCANIDTSDSHERKTRTKLANAAGVSTGTIHKVETIIKEGSEKDKKDLREGKTSTDKVYKKIKKKKDKEKREKELIDNKNEINEQVKKNFLSVCDIRYCSMQDLLKTAKPDCIITDPPYPKEYLSLFEDLAKLSKNIPLVAVMCGQSYLPQIFSIMTKHLQYRWTLAYLTPGGQSAQLWKVKVNTFWKPVLLFGNSLEWIGDVCKSDVNDNDKRFHDWGQSESGMGNLVNRLSKPGQLICDPFVGGGTTALASLKLGRRFIGCDTDKEAIEKSIRRCEIEYELH